LDCFGSLRTKDELKSVEAERDLGRKMVNVRDGLCVEIRRRRSFGAVGKSCEAFQNLNLSRVKKRKNSQWKLPASKALVMVLSVS
jgi:hypothetical protein